MTFQYVAHSILCAINSTKKLIPVVNENLCEMGFQMAFLKTSPIILLRNKLIQKVRFF